MSAHFIDFIKRVWESLEYYLFFATTLIKPIIQEHEF